MARFKFHLQSVLNLRAAAEREQQRAVAELERTRMQLEVRLRRQQSTITSGREAMRGGLLGTVDVVALRSHAGSTMRLLRDAQGMAVELAKIYERIDRARADLAEAAAARRAMELLRDRRFAQWKADLEKREAAVIDDLTAAKAARSNAAEELDS